jgi:tripartite-type tricarboxylate transporter receptor subunit TctC
MRRPLLVLTLIAVLLGFASATALAQYPSKPIRFIVPWGAGSGPDVSSRIIAAELSTRLGQQIVIDNRPGAGGTIGMAIIARAAPDGYTIGPGNIGQTISYSVIPNVPYDLNKDFQSIGQTLVSANVLAVRLSLPVRSVQELIAYAKNNPGKLLYGSPGNGSSLHVGMELFKLMTGTQMVHVPFRDAQQAITGLVGGQVDLQFENLGAIVPHVKAGRVRGLAVTGPKRSPAVPELPTVAEAGVTGFEVITWAGVIGPSGVPKDIVAKLNAEINNALMSPALKERFAGLGLEPVGGTPEQFDALVKKEAVKWADVVKRAGVRVD